MVVLNGFIKIHRKLLNWGWYQDDVVKGVFLHLILTANFRATAWRDIVLQPGQVVTSYGRLADDLGFGVRQIRTALDKLKSTGELTSKATNKYQIITVVNWEDYQCYDDDQTSKTADNASAERQATDNQLTNNRQQRKNKRIKEEKKYIKRAPTREGFFRFNSSGKVESNGAFFKLSEEEENDKA